MTEQGRRSRVQGLSREDIDAGKRNPEPEPQPEPAPEDSGGDTPHRVFRSPDLSAPSASKGTKGDAEGAFLALTAVAVAGLAVLNVSPFSDLMTWTKDTVTSFAALAKRKAVQ